MAIITRLMKRPLFVIASFCMVGLSLGLILVADDSDQPVSVVWIAIALAFVTFTLIVLAVMEPLVRGQQSQPKARTLEEVLGVPSSPRERSLEEVLGIPSSPKKRSLEEVMRQVGSSQAP